jgi:dienelactone hydrolase
MDENVRVQSVVAGKQKGTKSGKRVLKIYGGVGLFVRLFLLFAFCISFVLTLFPWGRAVARTTLIMPSLISGEEPAMLKDIGEPIDHKQMSIPSRDGQVYLDIYAPATSTPLLTNARSGILIIPGVGDNRQVPQLVNFSQTLARTGLVVMDMTTPMLMNYEISAQDSDAAVQAFNTLSNLPGMSGRKSGILAFSGGAPIACFAAADPRIKNAVAFVALFGGYFNAATVLQAFGQRAQTLDGKRESWEPTDVPLRTFANLITAALPFAEQQLITEALSEGGTQLSSSDIAGLSPAGRAAYQLLTGTARQSVNANIAALPAATRAQLVELSPNRVIDQIRAPIFLLHDRNDTSIPVAESRAFTAALQRIHHPYHYVEFHIFDHVQVRSSYAISQLLSDGTNIFSILTQLLIASS